MALNNSHLLPLLVSVGQEFASSLLDVLAQSLSRGCSEMSAGAAVISKPDCSWRVRFQGGSLTWVANWCWLCVNLHSIVLNVFTVQYVSLSVLTVWWLASFRGSNPNETKAEASLPFATFQYSLLGLYSVVFYWSHRPDLIHCGRELCKAMNTRR